MNIPSIPTNPPHGSSYTFAEIREWLMCPRYLDGEKKGQRIRVEYILFDSLNKRNVARIDVICSFWFKLNNVSIHSTETNYSLLVFDRNANEVIHWIPASIAYFICEIHK